MNRLLQTGVAVLMMLPGCCHQAAGQAADRGCDWRAHWICDPQGPTREYGAHFFRKGLHLDSVPASLVVHTAGDTRYQLFVNGQFVTLGTQRGDLRHYYYETTDIAPWLQPGDNVIAAVVLNYGAVPPDAEVSVQTAFLLSAEEQRWTELNTPTGWKSFHSPCYRENLVDPEDVTGYYGGGSRERFDARLYPWGWQHVAFDDASWRKARTVERAFGKSCEWASRWKLTPRTLPHERQDTLHFQAVRWVENVSLSGDPLRQGAMTVPPNTQGQVLLDFGQVTTAYPMVTLAGGKDATMELTYAEAGYVGEPKQKNKGHRGRVEGKQFVGYSDLVTADGQQRTYVPLWWRTFRYVLLDISTADQPLTLSGLRAAYTTYPFDSAYSFAVEGQDLPATNEEVQQVLQISEHTLRLNAHEHFSDCPYYEESQFVGDTRVEALVSYYLFGDVSLGRQAVDQFSWSINDEGFLSARYPTNSYYYIPNFSLYWVGMLHDYWLHAGDSAFVSSKLPVVHMILDYFEGKVDDDGLLSGLDYHTFTDWSFQRGEPPQGQNGHSAVADLHYLMALGWAADLAGQLGQPDAAKRYTTQAQQLRSTVRRSYWSEKLGLFTDVPGDSSQLSQHTNCLAVLTGAAEPPQAAAIMQQVLQHPGMVQATLYWQFYVHEALLAAGLGDKYLDRLDIWTQLLDYGVTSWPETGLRSRSESHGWGSSPAYHLLKISAGVAPASPGFQSVRIAPHLGEATALEATVPHPQGQVEVAYRTTRQGLRAEVVLPEGIGGTLHWQGQSVRLQPGAQQVKLKLH